MSKAEKKLFIQVHLILEFQKQNDPYILDQNENKG